MLKITKKILILLSPILVFLPVHFSQAYTLFDNTGNTTSETLPITTRKYFTISNMPTSQNITSLTFLVQLNVPQQCISVFTGASSTIGALLSYSGNNGVGGFGQWFGPAQYGRKGIAINEPVWVSVDNQNWNNDGDPNAYLTATNYNNGEVNDVTSVGIFTNGALSGDCEMADVTWTIYGNLNDNGYIGHYTDTNTSTYPALSFNEQTNTAQGVWFQTPQYADGFISPDFSTWWACIRVTSGDYGAGVGYNIKVHYGASTSTMTTVDDIATDYGWSPINELPKYQCPYIGKNATSSPGTYYAYLTGERRSASGTVTGIATSTTITFHITEGQRRVYVADQTYNKDYEGQDRYRQLLQKKFPFEYFYQVSDIIDIISEESTNATFTTLSLTASIPTGINASYTPSFATVSMPFFDKAEIFKVLPESSWTLISQIQSAGLIIGTVWYVFGRIKSYKQGGVVSGGDD